MREAGFSVMEVLVVVVLLSAAYAFIGVNFEARRQAAEFAAGAAQARAWAEIAEVERQRGLLQAGDDLAGIALRTGETLPLQTPFGGDYQVLGAPSAAVVAFDGPLVRHGNRRVTVHALPNMRAPTMAMRDKLLLYRQAIR